MMGLYNFLLDDSTDALINIIKFHRAQPLVGILCHEMGVVVETDLSFSHKIGSFVTIA